MEKKTKVGLLLPEEAERLLTEEFGKVSDHSFGVAQTDEGYFPYFIQQKIPLKPDSDGGLWWQANIQGTVAHFFIHVGLRKGELCFPLCLVNPDHRKFAYAVAKTTFVEKFNEKEATVLIGNSLNNCYPIHFSAAPLCVSLTVSELFPTLERFASKNCLGCKNLARNMGEQT